MVECAEYMLWVDGKRLATGRTREIRVPFDGSLVGVVHQAGLEHVEVAVAAALRAAREMRDLTLDERSTILRRAWLRLGEQKDEMASIISAESGKPLAEARAEVGRALQTLLFSSEEAHRLAGEVVPMEASPAGKGRWAMTLREPVGVVAAITPFNFPLNLSMHKIGPALAAGNAVVHKPASATPITALRLAELFQECGLPAGALNVIPGPGVEVGDALVTHPGVAMVTFTGSPEVGIRIRSMAGMKRVTLELGNNSAVILDADADLEDALPRCLTGAYANSGQVCISVQRIFAHRRIHAEFVERFAAAAQSMKTGHPLDSETEISSLITDAEAQRVELWVKEAVEAGARLVAGGERSGAAMQPVVLERVPPDARVFAKEVFGPVAGINAFDSLEEAVEWVNRSDYGLQAGLFTRDLSKAFWAARQVHVGGFLINDVPQFRVDQMPYGGVKLSGLGREGPRYAIEEMTEIKLVSWRP